MFGTLRGCTFSFIAYVLYKDNKDSNSNTELNQVTCIKSSLIIKVPVIQCANTKLFGQTTRRKSASTQNQSVAVFGQNSQQSHAKCIKPSLSFGLLYKYWWCSFYTWSFINIDRINCHSMSAARSSDTFAAGGSAVGLLTGQTRVTLAASYQHKILYVYREEKTWLDMFALTCVILGLHPSLFSGSAASYARFPRHNKAQSNLPRPNRINVKNTVRISKRMTGVVSGPMMDPVGLGWLFTVWTHLRMKNNLFYYNWFSFTLQLISQWEDFSL